MCWRGARAMGRVARTCVGCVKFETLGSRIDDDDGGGDDDGADDDA